jgi:catechol 2,3-dioxygenase-like lactoylglutathione lyase family enzyme
MLTRATYVTLFVSDQDKALDFYVNTLGFEKRGDNPSGGARFLTVGLKDQDLQLVLWPGTPGRATQTPGATPGALILETNDCRKDFATLTARGARFETTQVLEQPWALVAVLVDPDGNRLMLRENRQPSAPR